MKKLFKIVTALFFMSTALALSSCSQDDEDMQKLIIGDWKFKEGQYKNFVHAPDNPYGYAGGHWSDWQSMENADNIPASYLEECIRFAEDGKFYEDGHDYNVTWILMDGKITFTQHKKNNQKRRDDQYTIDELTKNKLVLSRNKDISDDEFDDYEPFIVTYKKI